MIPRCEAELIFQPPLFAPEVGEWWNCAVDAYAAGDVRGPDEEYFAEIVATEDVDGELLYSVQDLQEESGLEEHVSQARFVNKLDPRTINVLDLSERSFAILKF